MKIMHFPILIAAFFPALMIFADARGVKFPDSQDPKVFSKQIESMINDSIDTETSIISSSNPELSLLTKEDSRDWESTLSKIANHPDLYGTKKSMIALDIANHRGTLLKSPELIQAAINLFQIERDRSLQKMDEYLSNGEPIHYTAWANLAGFIAESLRKFHSPELLLEVLVYFSSDYEKKLGLINQYAPKHIAAALRDYGDARHIEQAAKFAQKLRDVGKGDIADDVERSIKRIMKDATGKQAASTEGANGSPKDASAPDDEAKDSANGTPLWPWLAAGGALIAALVGYFRMKRAQT
jgi:hypothetical protein